MEKQLDNKIKIESLRLFNMQLNGMLLHFVINFSKKDYEAKNIPFEREIQSFESFITEIANTVNDNKGTLADAVEMAEQSFKSM